jgi:hypothetical protein
MSYFNIAQEGHLVNVIAPVDINAGVDGDAFSMENWSHASIIITLGVTHSTGSVVTVYECADNAAGDDVAIAFKLASEVTAGGDVLEVLTDVTSSGFTTTVNDGALYTIELDAADLSAGYPYVNVKCANPGGATFGSVVAVLSGGRYASSISPTVL